MAYACRDLEATHHFYEDLMGFKLVHTEVNAFDRGDEQLMAAVSAHDDVRVRRLVSGTQDTITVAANQVQTRAYDTRDCAQR